MKKVISVFLIVIILINLIPVKSFSVETTDPTESETTEETVETTDITEPEAVEEPLEPEDQADPVGEKKSAVNEIIDPDEAAKLIPDPDKYMKNLEKQRTTIRDKDGNEKDNVSTTGTTYMSSTIFGVISHILGSIPQVVNQFLEIVLQKLGGEHIEHFTIYDTVLGNYEVFNITYNVIPSEITNDSTADEIYKSKVIQFYYIVRNISVALILFVLLYIGIRMAISTLASDKAKYKQMLISWAISLVLVFAMQYIIVIISVILNSILEILRNIANGMNITSTLHVSQVESQIFTDASALYGKANGWNLISAVFTMWVLVYYELKFFLMYIGRIVEIGFLIIIAPLVTVTYAIDKVGDGKAQAFTTWLNELLMKAAIQVVHAVLYLIFIASAGYIATQHPLLAAVFFAFLGRSEKILKNILNVKNSEFEKVKVPFSNKH